MEEIKKHCEFCKKKVKDGSNYITEYILFSAEEPPNNPMYYCNNDCCNKYKDNRHGPVEMLETLDPIESRFEILDI